MQTQVKTVKPIWTHFLVALLVVVVVLASAALVVFGK